jgi:hypothetical protein
MKMSRSKHTSNPIHSNCKLSSRKLRMRSRRILPLVLGVLMTILAILQPTSAFALSNKNNCFRKAGIGQKSSIPKPPISLFQSDHMITGVNSLNASPASSSSDIDPSSLSSPDNDDAVRNRVRKLTGVSLTALRATMRTATGISMTVIYVSTKAATGAWIRTTMKTILAPFPASFRYFVQPFLVLYYAPLFILRSLTGPTHKNAQKVHEEFLQSRRRAVETAHKRSSYWPLHLDKDGYIEADFEEIDVNEVILESVQIAEDIESNSL